MAVASPELLIRTDLYPVSDVNSAVYQRLHHLAQSALDKHGVFVLQDFFTDQALAEIRQEAIDLAPQAHHMNRAASPYPYLPENDDFPEDHPRRTRLPTSLHVLSYKTIPPKSPLRALYEWDPLMKFVGRLIGVNRIYRYSDSHGALNLSVMIDGDEMGWHFDETDFVVSIVLQQPEAGGEFLCAPGIRSDSEDNYEKVEEVLQSRADSVSTIPMKAGSLILFKGRHSLHCVTRIAGKIPRIVALLAYDVKETTSSSAELRKERYGVVDDEGDATVAAA